MLIEEQNQTAPAAEPVANPAAPAAEPTQEQVLAAPAEPAQQDPAAQAAEPAPAEPVAQPQAKEQDPETRKQFAQQRRENEAVRKILSGLVNPVTGKAFETVAEFQEWKENIRVNAAATKAGISPEEYAAMEENAAKRLKESDPDILAQRIELEQYRQEKQQQTFAADLAAIKKAYPDEKAADIGQLGDAFIAMMTTGKVSALAAYEAVRAQQQREKPQPQSMGDLGGNAGKEKDFYSREEVAKMSPAEVSKNFDKIRQSQAKW